MGRLGRSVILALFALLPACGCGATKRPYAHDPVLRERNAVWGDHTQAYEFTPNREVDPPRPPRPVVLPTLEWEAGKLEQP
jgi:hypothetical protein